MTTSSPPPDPDAFHQAFSWLPSHHQSNEAAQFYALTMDVCHGIQICMDLVQVSTADRGTDTAPTLDIIATERLLRLALTSSQMLADTAARHIDKLDSRFRQGLSCPPMPPTTSQ